MWGMWVNLDMNGDKSVVDGNGLVSIHFQFHPMLHMMCPLHVKFKVGKEKTYCCVVGK